MAKQTINIGASPNDGTGTPLRTSFDYCNQNFTELYTATGPSGNNIVVPGNATITGDLAVRTTGLTVNSSGVGIGLTAALGAGNIQIGAGKYLGYSANSYITPEDNVQGARIKTSGNITLEANAATNFSIGGSTAMTLNSTGLGVGVSPGERLTIQTALTGTTVGSNTVGRFQSNGSGYDAHIALGDNVNPSARIGYLSSAMYFWTNGAERVRIDSSGNVGVGVTPSANKFQVAGNIGLPNSCTASGETSGVFSIDVSNLLALTGGSWRQCSFLLVYSGVDTGLGNSTVLQTVVTLQGLSTYDTISKNDIVGTASVAVSNDTSSGARITVTVPTGNAGSVYVMLLGGAGATTRPSITINA